MNLPNKASPIFTRNHGGKPGNGNGVTLVTNGDPRNGSTGNGGNDGEKSLITSNINDEMECDSEREASINEVGYVCIGMHVGDDVKASFGKSKDVMWCGKPLVKMVCKTILLCIIKC